jgi:hypothetical protein
MLLKWQKAVSKGPQMVRAGGLPRSRKPKHVIQGGITGTRETPELSKEYGSTSDTKQGRPNGDGMPNGCFAQLSRFWDIYPSDWGGDNSGMSGALW